MSDFITILLYASLPAIGNFVGGLLAEAITISQRTLSLALHAAAGIILAVVGIELMPEALQAQPPWAPILAFVAGGIFFLLLDSFAGIVSSRFPVNADESGATGNPWAIFFGVAMDLFSDGLMIGVGSTLDLRLGLLLAISQVTADLPEGFATMAGFKRHGLPRRLRLLLMLSFALPVLLGALVGYGFLRGQPDVLKLVMLAFTAGVLSTLVIEEIVPEAHREEEARLAALVFVGGFALFALISTYFG